MLAASRASTTFRAGLSRIGNGLIVSHKSSRPQRLFPSYIYQKRFQSVVADPPSLDSIQADNTPPPRSRVRRFFSATALIVVFFSVGLTMSTVPAVNTLNGVIAPPTDAETLSLFVPASDAAAQINDHIVNHPLSQSLRADPAFSESRPHLKIPAAMRAHNLTGGTLIGDEKLAVPPLNFANVKTELPTLVQISHVGDALCGHPGIIHGGMLATLLDEGLARTCFPALPNKVGVTASLTINYKKPCPANSYLVLRAETTKVEGRKAWVKGWIEVLGEGVEEGDHLVEAEALFIEPKGAKNMGRLYSQ